jgi:hypothetical protein
MHVGIKQKYLFYILMNLSFIGSACHGQATNENITAQFIKKQLIQSCDSLSFNVLQVINNTCDTITFSPTLHLPGGFTLMSRLPQKFQLPPQKHKNIPLRIGISPNVWSGKAYTVKVSIRVNTYSNEINRNYNITIIPKREWNMQLYQQKVILPTEKHSETSFCLVFKNTGNTPEKIHLKMAVPDNLQVQSAGKKAQDVILMLPPGKDSLYTYKLVRRFKNTSTTQKERIKIDAYNDVYTMNKYIDIESYYQTFVFMPPTNKTKNYIEYVGYESGRQQQQTRHQFSTSGEFPLDSARKKINFSFMNSNLTGEQDLLKTSRYNISFQTPHLHSGLGNASSSLAENLYLQKGVYANIDIPLNSKNKLLFYTGKSTEYNNQAGASGYEYQADRFLLRLSGGYSQNQHQQINTSSSIIKSNWSISKSTLLQGLLRNASRTYYRDSVYSSVGTNGRFSLRGKISTPLSYNLGTHFQTPGYYTAQRQLFSTNSQLSFRNPQKTGSVQAGYSYTRQSSGSSQGYTRSATEYTNQAARLTYGFKAGKHTRLHTGILLESTQTGSESYLNKNHSYNLLFGGNRSGKLNYTFECITGIRKQEKHYPFLSTLNIKTQTLLNFHFKGTLRNKWAGMQIGHNFGSRHTGSYYVKDNYYRFQASSYLRKNMLGKRVSLQILGSYVKDWISHIRCEGNYAAYHRQNNLYGDARPTMGIRFSTRKNFNLSPKHRSGHHNLDVLFFRDDNKNGLMDEDETGIESGYFHIKNQETHNVRLAPLLSGEKGKVSYNNIPEGIYQLHFKRLNNTDGYFNFGESKKEMHLAKDTICYVPFVKAYRIFGSLTLRKPNVSSGKVNSVKNIRVTAIDKAGKQYSALTDQFGNFQLPVAGKDEYIVSIHNPYGSRINVLGNQTMVNFTDNDAEKVDFIFVEKKRRVNMKKVSSANNTTKNTQVRNSKVIQPVLNDTLAHLLQRKNNEYWIYTRKSASSFKKYYVVGAFRIMGNAIRKIDILKANNIKAAWIFEDNYQLYYVYLQNPDTDIHKFVNDNKLSNNPFALLNK